MNEIKKLICGDNEENATIYEVGKHEVIGITEHRAQGEGDKWYYDVDSEIDLIRIFNPLRVEYKKGV